VTGDGLPDLVVSLLDPDPWLVFAGTVDGSFETTPRADLTFDPLPLSVRFALVPGESGAADLLLEVGPSLTVLRNDGLGHFR
jgi:hypothetical protein